MDTDLVEYVRKMPQPGSGSCNRYLLGAANVGIKAGLSDYEILRTILCNLKHPGPGTDRAIERAIYKARYDAKSPAKLCLPPPQKSRHLDPRYKQWLTRRKLSLEDAKKESPISITGRPLDNSIMMLLTLFDPDDLLYIGDRFGNTINPVGHWAENPSQWGEFIIPNPLTGQEHTTKNGKASYRCDAAIKRWKYIVAEFDSIPIEEQLSIWLTIDLPIAALIYSGGKSVHAWIYADIATDQIAVVQKLYADVIVPLGGDPACKNPSRLSRMPGVYRADKAATQKLVWMINPATLEVIYGSENSSGSGDKAKETHS